MIVKRYNKSKGDARILMQNPQGNNRINLKRMDIEIKKKSNTKEDKAWSRFRIFYIDEANEGEKVESDQGQISITGVEEPIILYQPLYGWKKVKK